MVRAPGLPRRCGARQPGNRRWRAGSRRGARALPQQRPVRGAGRAASGAKTEAQEPRTRGNPEADREALAKSPKGGRSRPRPKPKPCKKQSLGRSGGWGGVRQSAGPRRWPESGAGRWPSGPSPAASPPEGGRPAPLAGRTARGFAAPGRRASPRRARTPSPHARRGRRAAGPRPGRAGLTGSASAQRPLPTAQGAGSSRPTGEAKCAVPGARAVPAEPAWARLGEAAAGVRGALWAA